MLEYAANGHYYWTTPELAAFAEQSSKDRGNSIEEELKRINWPNSDEPETYFQAIEENLREGQVRLIFFLEEAPFELKSIVEFLNSQMERSEVLVVEARRYQIGNERIISPALFGYSEEARFIKGKVTVESGRKQKWDSDSFFEHSGLILDSSGVRIIRALLEECERLGCERDEETRDQLKSILTDLISLTVQDDYQVRFPWHKLDEWSNKAEELVRGLKILLDQKV